MFTFHAYLLSQETSKAYIISQLGRQLGMVKHSCPKNDTKQWPPIGLNDHGGQWLPELQKNSFNFGSLQSGAYGLQ